MKGKNKESSSARNVSATNLKKKKEGDHAKPASKVSSSSHPQNSNPKLPFKTRSFNNREGQLSKVDVFLKLSSLLAL